MADITPTVLNVNDKTYNLGIQIGNYTNAG